MLKRVVKQMVFCKPLQKRLKKQCEFTSGVGNHACRATPCPSAMIQKMFIKLKHTRAHIAFVWHFHVEASLSYTLHRKNNWLVSFTFTGFPRQTSADKVCVVLLKSMQSHTLGRRQTHFVCSPCYNDKP